MTIMDRIKTKISPTNAPIATADGIDATTLVKEPARPAPKVRLPIQEGELLPWKGLVFKIKTVGENEFTATCLGLTHARARKLGLA